MCVYIYISSFWQCYARNTCDVIIDQSTASTLKEFNHTQKRIKLLQSGLSSRTASLILWWAILSGRFEATLSFFVATLRLMVKCETRNEPCFRCNRNLDIYMHKGEWGTQKAVATKSSITFNSSNGKWDVDIRAPHFRSGI